MCWELHVRAFGTVQGHPPAILQVSLASHAALGQRLASAPVWEPFLQYNRAIKVKNLKKETRTNIINGLEISPLYFHRVLLPKPVMWAGFSTVKN